MMNEQIVIDSINRSEAFRYMAAEGYEPVGEAAEIADECEKRLLGAVRPLYTYKIFGIESNDGSRVIPSGCSIVFEGRDVCSMLEGCHSVVIMCATVGADVDRLIRVMQIEDMAKAFMADSFASVAVEQVCTRFDEMLRSELEDKFITWRFSPGYGDFPLEIQGRLLDVINARKTVGVSINSAGLMTPVKSVTAVCGISDSELPRRRRGCASCRLASECAYRKKGTRCEY